MNDTLLSHRQDRVLHLVINRPERRNALDLATYTALADALEGVGSDPEVRVVLLSGAEGCFTSGNDLEDFLAAGELDEAHPVRRFMLALLDCPSPVITAVEGPAVGIGTTLLLHTDLNYADEGARFQLPFVNLGLVPEYASSRLLPQLVGHAVANELLLLGEPFDAERARALGLVNEVVAEGRVLERACERAVQLAAQPPAAVRAARRLLRGPRRAAALEAMETEFTAFARALHGEEFREAANAFFEKRAPDFSGLS